jgi:hypothetical protein
MSERSGSTLIGELRHSEDRPDWALTESSRGYADAKARRRARGNVPGDRGSSVAGARTTSPDSTLPASLSPGGHLPPIQGSGKFTGADLGTPSTLRVSAAHLVVAVAEWDDDPKSVVAASTIPRKKLKSSGSRFLTRRKATQPDTSALAILQPRLGIVLAPEGPRQEPLFVPALRVDGWRSPRFLGPRGHLLATFGPGALPRDHDLDFGLLGATDVSDTLLAPAASSGRAVAGGRWGLAWPVAECSGAEAAAWALNIALFAFVAAALLDTLLVSGEVSWSSGASWTFFLSLVHSLLTADGIKVGILVSIATSLVPLGSAPKSKAAKRCRRALHAVANFLQALL